MSSAEARTLAGSNPAWPTEGIATSRERSSIVCAMPSRTRVRSSLVSIATEPIASNDRRPRHTPDARSYERSSPLGSAIRQSYGLVNEVTRRA